MLGTVPAPGITNANGDVVWSVEKFAFEGIDAECPDTVNPSLWRQAKLNNVYGLFEVTEGVYQVRNLDLANMTIIESDTGIIIIDTTSTVEQSKAALELYYSIRGEKPVKAVLITHSHVDHYGGLAGVVSQADIDSGKVPLYVPDGFLFEAISENAYVGNIMSRRMYNQVGIILPADPKGQVDEGLGKGGALNGEVSLLVPSHIIKEKRETHVIDGFEIEFMLVPGTEAPAEMIMYMPSKKILLPAELITHNLHNVLTLRGALVRDTRLWWQAIDDMLQIYGDKTEIICAVHHWPTWGHDRCIELMEVQRDTYKYMLDQTLRLMNLGYNMVEIAEMMELPPKLGNHWSMRGYYGTLNHDVKAIYQRYLGWFDMNPANLHPLPPVEQGKAYVEFGGGSEAVLAKVKAPYENGEYRFGAEIGKHLVFAEPDNKEAMLILADIYEQMGYQSEAGTWRDTYLMGALELRAATVGKCITPPLSTLGVNSLNAIEDYMLFDFLSMLIVGPKMMDKPMNFKLVQSDRKSTYALELNNGVLIFHENKELPNVDATITLNRNELSLLTLKTVKPSELIASGKMSVEGNTDMVEEFFTGLDEFTLDINIARP